MKSILISLLAIICTVCASSQSINNTSYETASGEKVLRLEFVIPVGQAGAWEYFSSDEKLIQWIAPVAHIELRTGGFIVTNYDKNKSLSDTSSIRVGITNYVERELLTLKVKLNDNFPKKAQAEDQNLQEIIQFTPIDSHHTRIVSSMVGWGEGDEWEKIYHFFDRGNMWTYDHLLKVFK